MRLVQKVAPTDDTIVKLADVKEYLSETDSDKDTEIKSMLAGVISHGEKTTNRQFGAATFELYRNDLSNGFKLPKNPIESIVKIELMGEDGTYTELDSSKYYLYYQHEVGVIKLLESITYKDHEEAVKITFECGYPADELPKDIEQWILYKCKCLYDDDFKPSEFVDNMLLKYKIRSL